MLTDIAVTIALENTSSIDLTSVIFTEGESLARNITVTRPTGYEVSDGYTCICQIKNSERQKRQITVPSSNTFTLESDFLTAGTNYLQFTLTDGEVVIKDNTILEIPVTSSL